MWKYMTPNKCKELLLSFNLLNQNDYSKDILKRLYSISNNIENNYTIHKIKKRNGKIRTIYEPNYTLKQIQRNILKNILNDVNISKYAKAYKKGISLKDNALPHVGKNIILKLDIKNFFDSISFFYVYNSCFPIELYPKNIGILLTKLCTYYDFLPQGAPTSSYISNIVMKKFDEEIGQITENLNIEYTRYSDDLTFSGDFDPKYIINIVKKKLNKMGLKLNYDKIRVIGKGSRQCVTGVVVNTFAQTSSVYRKKIRQEIYFIKKYGLESHLNRINYSDAKDKYLYMLKGKINFVLNINSNDVEFINYKNYLNSL